MGEEFATMAAQPFAFIGNFPHRILGPLLAWCLQLGGERYWIFHHAVVVLMLTIMAAGAMMRGCTPLRAALLTLVLASAGAVKAYKTAVGYVDPLTFALLIATSLATSSSARFWALLLAALLSHELTVLFVPWLLLLRHIEGGGLRRLDLLGAATTFGLYASFRLAVSAARPTGTWNTQFFWSQASLSVDTVAMWTLLTVIVVISNGPLLVALFWHAFDRAAGKARIATGVFVLGLYCTAIAALDLWRFAGLAIVPLWFAGTQLVQRARGPWVLLVLGAATMATSDLQFGAFEHLAVSVLSHNQERHIVLAVIIDEWPLFAGYAFLLVALAATGFWLARSVVGHMPEETAASAQQAHCDLGGRRAK